jgi:hypothetical protein
MKVAARKLVKEAGKDYHILIKIVRQNPGIHFRELLRASGLKHLSISSWTTKSFFLLISFYYWIIDLWICV